MKLQLAYAIALATIASSSNAYTATPTQYFCSVDDTTGFYFKDGKWGVANFDAHEKYIVKEVVSTFTTTAWATGDVLWEVTEVGASYSIALCSDWTSNAPRQRTANIECLGPNRMRFNKKTLRFIHTNFSGYTGGANDNENTPFLAIGKCSPL